MEPFIHLSGRCQFLSLRVGIAKRSCLDELGIDTFLYHSVLGAFKHLFGRVGDQCVFIPLCLGALQPPIWTLPISIAFCTKGFRYQPVPEKTKYIWTQLCIEVFRYKPNSGKNEYLLLPIHVEPHRYKSTPEKPRQCLIPIRVGPDRHKPSPANPYKNLVANLVAKTIIPNTSPIGDRNCAILAIEDAPDMWHRQLHRHSQESIIKSPKSFQKGTTSVRSR